MKATSAAVNPQQLGLYMRARIKTTATWIAEKQPLFRPRINNGPLATRLANKEKVRCARVIGLNAWGLSLCTKQLRIFRITWDGMLVHRRVAATMTNNEPWAICWKAFHAWESSHRFVACQLSRSGCFSVQLDQQRWRVALVQMTVTQTLSTWYEWERIQSWLCFEHS